MTIQFVEEKKDKTTMHITIFLAGVVEAEVLTPTDVRVELRTMQDSGSTYASGSVYMSPNVYKVVQMTGAQVLLDALQKKLKDTINQLSWDITLAAGSQGGDA